MKVVITGASSGIGLATAKLFLDKGHFVCGLDIRRESIEHNNYLHYRCDISESESLPDIENVEILINNAGVQTGTLTDISVNLVGSMNVTKKYTFQDKIKSVLFISSVSALTGNEFDTYVASKAGINGYMKNVAIRLANEFRATCNALCFGGVATELNAPVMHDHCLWQKIMEVTPLKRWATVEQAAKWCYFLTVVNDFATGQTIDVSGGERNCADLFVWA